MASSPALGTTLRPEIRGGPPGLKLALPLAKLRPESKASWVRSAREGRTDPPRQQEADPELCTIGQCASALARGPSYPGSAPPPLLGGLAGLNYSAFLCTHTPI